jgi:hypothetical protein
MSEPHLGPKTNQPKTKRPRRPRREYGIGDFLSWMHSGGGLRQAVRRVAYEDRQEKLFKDMDSEGQAIQ